MSQPTRANHPWKTAVLAGMASYLDAGALIAAARSDTPNSRESLLIGAPLTEALDLARRASPVTYVHPGAPPFHIAHGDADRFVPVGQSRRLADALRAAGVEVEFTEVPDGDHMWMGVPQPVEIFDAAVGFARRVTADNTTL